MTEGVMDFPFVASLPKRDKSKFATVWERFQELAALTEEKGMLMPVGLAAKVLAVSRQRAHQLINDGRLETHDVDGHIFVTENSVLAYVSSERKSGRPPKLPTNRELLKASWQGAKEICGVKKKA